MAWWQSDGTSAGTYTIVDSNFLLKGKPINYNSRMYFFANNALWESEGDSTSTSMVKPIGDTVTNINLSFGDNIATDFWYDYIQYDGSLFFSASWGQTGKEVWKISTTPLKVISYDTKDIEFSIYPNPAHAVLNILSENVILHAEIFDLHGRLISSSTNKRIAIDNLTNGLYVLRLTTKQGIGSAKFLIEK